MSAVERAIDRLRELATGPVPDGPDIVSLANEASREFRRTVQTLEGLVLVCEVNTVVRRHMREDRDQLRERLAESEQKLFDVTLCAMNLMAERDEVRKACRDLGVFPASGEGDDP